MLRAAPMPEGFERRSCLIIAPHPDDETFGCGGLVALKRAAGAAVDVLVLTDGDRSHPEVSPIQLGRLRRRELHNACTVLGLDSRHVHALGLRDRSLREQRGTVVRHVAELVQTLQPDEVLVTSHLDGHEDHVAAFEATREALRLVPGPRLLEYPVWCWYRGPLAALEDRERTLSQVFEVVVNLFIPPRGERVAVDRVRTVKARAVNAYSTQLRGPLGDGSWSTMPKGFVALFLRPHEIYFACPRVLGRRAA